MKRLHLRRELKKYNDGNQTFSFIKSQQQWPKFAGKVNYGNSPVISKWGDTSCDSKKSFSTVDSLINDIQTSMRELLAWQGLLVNWAQ